MIHEHSTSKFASALRRFWALPIIVHARTPLYRNGYALLLSSALTSVLGVVYWVLAARYYPVAVVGVNSAVIAAMSFFSALTRLNMNGVLVRFIPCAGQSTSRLIGYAYGLSLLAALLTMGVCLLLTPWLPLQQFSDATPLFLAWFVISTLAMNIFVLQDHVLTGMRQTLWIPVENTIYAIAKIILLVIFATLVPRYGVFLSWTAPFLAISLPLNMLIFRRFVPAHTAASRNQELPIISRQMIGYIASDYVGAMFSMASTLLLPIMVTALAGATANAYFYLPWMIASSLQLVAVNMTMSLTVESAADQDRLNTYARQVFVHIIRLLVPVVAVVLLGAPYLLHIFGRAYAEEGAVLLRLFVLATLPNVFVMLYLSIARVQGRLTEIVVVQGTLCLLVLGLSYVLLQTYGIIGVGSAWLVGQAIVATYLAFGPLRPIIWRSLSRRPVVE